jgi:nucleotide-binding universal stress UspA family protein
MNTIICATDFSTNGNNAVKYATAFAKQLNATVRLVHVYENPILYSEQPLASIQMADEQVRLSAEKKLSDLKNKIIKEQAGISLETILIEGQSNDELTAFADQQHADLIVLGTTGTTRLERLLMGSTTAHVIRKANCPVLCIPREAKFDGIRKIIFTTDLHEDNMGAAESIEKFAKHFDSEIIFLYVDDHHLIHTDEEIVRTTAKIKSRIHYQKISGYISKDPHIHKGIQSFIKKHAADLMVMLTHRKHFPETVFHTSLTNMMSHQTRIPLLSIKISDAATLKKI